MCDSRNRGKRWLKTSKEKETEREKEKPQRHSVREERSNSHSVSFMQLLT